jgi:hypothetical protein
MTDRFVLGSGFNGVAQEVNPPTTKVLVFFKTGSVEPRHEEFSVYLCWLEDSVIHSVTDPLEVLERSPRTQNSYFLPKPISQLIPHRAEQLAPNELELCK